MEGSPRQPLPCDNVVVCMDPLALCPYKGENTYFSIKKNYLFLCVPKGRILYIFYIEVYMDGIIMSFDAAGWRAPVHDLLTSVQARIQMEYFKLQYFQQ